MLNSRMTAYVAPDGYVYDYLEPHIAIIIDTNGEKIETEEHLYAKYLYLGKFDDINSYKVVKDPRKQENNVN